MCNVLVMIAVCGFRVEFVSGVPILNVFQCFMRRVCVGNDLTYVLKLFRQCVKISFRHYTNLQVIGSSCFTVLAKCKNY